MKTRKLFNGQTVKEGDLVTFMDSDNFFRTGKIKTRTDGSLYFWNSTHDILEYQNAERVTND